MGGAEQGATALPFLLEEKDRKDFAFLIQLGSTGLGLLLPSHAVCIAYATRRKRMHGAALLAPGCKSKGAGFKGGAKLW